MSLPKTFTAGERLFATDLNNNFTHLETEIDNAGAEFSTAGSDTVNIDFSKDRIITRTAAGAITFTGSNYTAGKSASVRIDPGASSRNLSFPADWKFVSFKPASLAANKMGILAVTSFTTGATGAIASFAEQI